MAQGHHAYNVQVNNIYAMSLKTMCPPPDPDMCHVTHIGDAWMTFGKVLWVMLGQTVWHGYLMGWRIIFHLCGIYGIINMNGLNLKSHVLCDSVRHVTVLQCFLLTYWLILKSIYHQITCWFGGICVHMAKFCIAMGYKSLEWRRIVLLLILMYHQFRLENM